MKKFRQSIFIIFTGFILFGISYTASGQIIDNDDIEVEKIADGFQFVEGPVWKDGSLLFSDIPQNTIYQWTSDGTVSVFLNPSGNSNGLALDLEGNLLMAQHGKRQVARLESNGTETPLATHYDGKKLNSPNDIAVKSDGSIYFTDPPYGISYNQEELGFYGIYMIDPSGKLYLLDKTLSRPNGIALSPDETKLYVSDSETRRIYVWDVDTDTTIVNKQLFAHLSAPGTAADGMKVDATGRLFATGPIGIWVINPDGSVIDTVSVPGQTSNCNWGGANGNTLYITSGNAVYRMQNVYTYIHEQKTGCLEQKSFQLFSNYPNPFNGKTQIPFYISKPGWVTIKIFNILGIHVDMLINQSMNDGFHHIAWNTKKFNSGIYYISLNTEQGSQFIKCSLIK